ncbi:MAG: alginate export family protein [Planctomycetota bacterium]
MPLTRVSLAGIAAAVAVPVAWAQPDAPTAPEAPAPAATEPAPETVAAVPVGDQIAGAIKNGKVSLDIRTRAEIADLEGLDVAQAYTIRTRLGYLTDTWEGFQLFAEFEDVRTLDDSLYNDGPGESTDGLDRSIVADPETSELNQAWITYANKDWLDSKVKAGRQLIVFDDQRFVGHVRWRQDDQTFDAVRLDSTFDIPDFNFSASYVTQVNRIFGEEADFNDADIVLLNAQQKVKGWGNLSVFGYLLDIDESPANSSNTVGFRFAGKRPLEQKGYGLNYAFSYAYQEDTGLNPTDYDASYYAVDLGLKTPKYGTFGAGYEVLGTDDGTFGFRTPLATLHKFNGFADQFLVTPAAGLEDIYAYVALPLPKESKAKAKFVYHYFTDNDNRDEFGQELDMVITQKWTENVSGLAKLAYFYADATGFRDEVVLTFDINIKF